MKQPNLLKIIGLNIALLVVVLVIVAVLVEVLAFAGLPSWTIFIITLVFFVWHDWIKEKRKGQEKQNENI